MMGRRKRLPSGDSLKVGDVLHFKGLKSRIPKLGAWSFELIGKVKNVTPLSVEVMYCNYPSYFGLKKKVEVNRRQWLESRTLSGNELKKWKLISKIDEH